MGFIYILNFQMYGSYFIFTLALKEKQGVCDGLL